MPTLWSLVSLFDDTSFTVALILSSLSYHFLLFNNSSQPC